MPRLLSSADAYREDLRINPGRPSLSTYDAYWILAAHAVEGMAACAPEERQTYSAGMGAFLESVLSEDLEHRGSVSRVTQTLREVTDALNATRSPDWARRLFNTYTRLVRDMEDAGVYHLSFTTLAHLRVALPSASPRQHGGALAQQARIARQLGDLAGATDLLASAEELARETSDDEVAARVSYGHGGLALMRGNHPLAREHYERALTRAQAAGSEEVVGLAHRGLLVTCATAGDFDAAIQHAWQAFQRDTGDPASQAELLSNLASVCLDGGHYQAALAAYAVAALWGDALRVRLPSLAGAALAASHLGNRERLDALAARVEREIASGAPPYESGLVLLELAWAFEVAGDRNANRYAERARALGVKHGFFELVYRAEDVTVRMRAHAAAGERQPAALSDAAASVLSSVSALAEATAAYAALVGVSRE